MKSCVVDHSTKRKQIYMFFMTWRYQKRLEHYNSMKGPFGGGELEKFNLTAERMCDAEFGSVCTGLGRGSSYPG